MNTPAGPILLRHRNSSLQVESLTSCCLWKTPAVAEVGYPDHDPRGFTCQTSFAAFTMVDSDSASAAAE